jgi:hypothetical protein
MGSFSNMHPYLECYKWKSWIESMLVEGVRVDVGLSLFFLSFFYSLVKWMTDHAFATRKQCNLFGKTMQILKT